MTARTHIIVAVAALLLCCALGTANYYRWEHTDVDSVRLTEPIPPPPTETATVAATLTATPVRTETAGPPLPPCHEEMAQLRLGIPTTIKNPVAEELLFDPSDGPPRVLESSSMNDTLVPGKNVLILEGHWDSKYKNPWIEVLHCEDGVIRELYGTTGSPTITGNTLVIDTYAYGFDDAMCCPYFDVLRTLRGAGGELVEEKPKVERMDDHRSPSSLGTEAPFLDEATLAAYAGQYTRRRQDPSDRTVAIEFLLQTDGIFIERRSRSYTYGQWIPHRAATGRVELRLVDNDRHRTALLSGDGVLWLLHNESWIDYVPSESE